MWLLKKGDLYVSANPNFTKSSYTNKLEYAKIYATKDQAVYDSCPESETPIHISHVLQGGSK